MRLQPTLTAVMLVAFVVCLTIAAGCNPGSPPSQVNTGTTTQAPNANATANSVSEATDPFKQSTAPPADLMSHSVTLAKAVEVGTVGHETCVVEGRVKDINAGFYAITLVDASLEYCGQTTPEDTCATPWDYCCEHPDTLSEKTLAVRFVDAKGNPVKIAQKPAYRQLDLIKVVGKIVVDKDGNRRVDATAYYLVSRPQVGAHVKWPSQ